MLEDKVLRMIQKENMIPPGSHILCGLSGGADSTALLLLLAGLREKLDFTLEAVHVEHGIRGAESLGDQQFAEELCAAREIPCRVCPVRVPEYANDHHLGLEEAARQLRYDTFMEIARETGGRVALAHHRKDQAETFLFDLVRGSSIRGLGGMAPVRRDPEGILYIRPLLEVDRGEIEAYLREQGQSWCMDSTNADPSYSRNRIRNRVLPELEAINPQAAAHIAEAARTMRELQAYMELQAREAFDSCRRQEDGLLTLYIPPLTELPSPIRKMVLMEALFEACGHRKDLGAVHVEGLENLLRGQSGRRMNLPYQIIAVREFDCLRFRRCAEKESGAAAEYHAAAAEKPQKAACPELLRIGEEQLGDLIENQQQEILGSGYRLLLRKRRFSGNFEEIPKNQYTKWFDYAKIKNGFSIRHRKSGDYLVIDGQFHRQKLKKYFTEAGIPAGERENLLLLASQKQPENIIWVIGGRISEAYKVTSTTQEVLEVQFTEE